MSDRRALVIGGSLGGLIVGASAAHDRLGRRRFRAQRRGAGEPRRRAWHAPAAHRHPQARRRRFRRYDGHHADRGRFASTATARSSSSGRRGARLSGWSRLYRALLDALPAHELSARQKAHARRAGRRQRHRVFRRRHAANAAICWSAPTASARPCARNSCRDVAAASMPAMWPGARCSTKPTCRPNCGARWSTSMRSVCPRASSSSATRCRDATTTRRSGAAPTTSSGTGRPIARALADMCTDAQGPPPRRRHPAAADPARRDRPRQSRRPGASSRRRSPRFSRAPRRSSSRSTTSRRRSLVFGRVVLAGDAAFVARPHAGAGTTKAALDAACLADSIRDAGDDLVPAWRATSACSYRSAARWSSSTASEGAYLSAQLKPKAERTADELAPRYRRGVARPYQPQRSGRRHRRRARP